MDTAGSPSPSAGSWQSRVVKACPAWSRRRAEDDDGDRGLAAGCADAAAGGVRGVDGDRSFDYPWVAAGAPGGHEVIENLAAEFTDKIDHSGRGGVGE